MLKLHLVGSPNLRGCLIRSRALVAGGRYDLQPLASILLKRRSLLNLSTSKQLQRLEPAFGSTQPQQDAEIVVQRLVAITAYEPAYGKTYLSDNGEPIYRRAHRRFGEEELHPGPETRDGCGPWQLPFPKGGKLSRAERQRRTNIPPSPTHVTAVVFRSGSLRLRTNR